MNKKMFTLIIVIFISFCFIGIVVAQNATHDNSTDHGKTIDNKIPVKNKTIDNKNDSNKSKHNYILAQGSGSDIRFSDGFRGFMLDYSKHPAKAGDEFKRASASKAGNSNTLELAVVECYKLGLSGQIGQIMAEFIQSGSSGSGVQTDSRATPSPGMTSLSSTKILLITTISSISLHMMRTE